MVNKATKQYIRDEISRLADAATWMRRKGYDESQVQGQQAKLDAMRDIARALDIR